MTHRISKAWIKIETDCIKIVHSTQLSEEQIALIICQYFDITDLSVLEEKRIYVKNILGNCESFTTFFFDHWLPNFRIPVFIASPAELENEKGQQERQVIINALDNPNYYLKNELFCVMNTETYVVTPFLDAETEFFNLVETLLKPRMLSKFRAIWPQDNSNFRNVGMTYASKEFQSYLDVVFETEEKLGTLIYLVIRNQLAIKAYERSNIKFVLETKHQIRNDVILALTGVRPILNLN